MKKQETGKRKTAKGPGEQDHILIIMHERGRSNEGNMNEIIDHANTMIDDITELKQKLRRTEADVEASGKKGQREMQKVTKKIKKVELRGSKQIRKLERTIREGNDHGSEQGTGRQHAREGERAAAATAACKAGACAAEAHAIAGTAKPMQAWDAGVTAMPRLSSQTMVSEAALTAIQTTATTWDFNAPDAVEAVMLKIVSCA